MGQSGRSGAGVLLVVVGGAVAYMSWGLDGLEVVIGVMMLMLGVARVAGPPEVVGSLPLLGWGLFMMGAGRSQEMVLVGTQSSGALVAIGVGMCFVAVAIFMQRLDGYQKRQAMEHPSDSTQQDPGDAARDTPASGST